MLTPTIERLVAELARLPGIGPRSAQRLAFHMMKAPPERSRGLSEAIADMTERLGPARCASASPRPTCARSAPTRAVTLAPVRGGGAVGDPPDRADQRVPGPLPRAGRRPLADRRGRPGGPAHPELVDRIDADGVVELVIATNPTMSGEATALHLADLVRGRVRVTRLASGLPVGADLEHADELTLGRALLGDAALETGGGGCTSGHRRRRRRARLPLDRRRGADPGRDARALRAVRPARPPARRGAAHDPARVFEEEGFVFVALVGASGDGLGAVRCLVGPDWLLRSTPIPWTASTRWRAPRRRRRRGLRRSRRGS